MVKLEDKDWDPVFKALSDSTRRGILSRVAKGNPTVSELAAPYQMSAPAISKHLRLPESSGLLTRVKEGKTHRFRLNPQRLEQAQTIMKQLTLYWTERLDNLEEYLADNSKDEKES